MTKHSSLSLLLLAILFVSAVSPLLLLLPVEAQIVKPPLNSGMVRHVIEGHEVVTSKDGSVLWEYPTYGWEIQSNEGFGLFIKYDFSVVGGRTLKNLLENPWREWNMTWRQKPYYEHFAENGTLLAVYENPIPKITQILQESKAIAGSGEEPKEGGIVLVSQPKQKTKQELAAEYEAVEFGKLYEDYAPLFADVSMFQSEAKRLELSYIGGNLFVLDERGSYVTGLALQEFFEVSPPSKLDLLGNGSLTFKLRNWKEGVRFKIGDPTYTYSTATNTITATGGTSGAPITFNDLWTADKAGTFNLASRAGISGTDANPVAVSSALRPADYVVLGGATGQDLYIVVSAWSGLTSAQITVVGTNRDGGAQSEVISVTGNGNYFTAQWFKTVTTTQVTAFVGAGSFTYTLTQGQWGVVWKQTTTQYQFDAKLQVGTAGTATYFTDTNKLVVFTYTNVAYSWAIIVRNDAVFTLGSLDNAASKTGENGVVLQYTGSKNVYMPMVDGPTGFVNLYGVTAIGPVGVRVYVDVNGNMYDCMLLNSAIFEIQGTSDVNRLTIINSGTAAMYPFKSGTFNDIFIASTNTAINYYTLAISTTITNLKARNLAVATFTFTGIGAYADQYVVDADVSWTLSGGVGNTGKLFRQYTFNLAIFNSTGVAISGATVTLKDAAAANVFSVNTAADGTIAEQTVSRGYYTSDTGNTLQDYGPFDLTISKAGYMPYTHNDIVLDEPLDWRCYMRTQLSGNATVGDVLLGETFYKDDADSKLTGTFALNGNATESDVVNGQTFFNNSTTQRTGSLSLTGNATAAEVMEGYSFYNTNPLTQLMGSLSLTGNATVGDVLLGQTFYNTDPKTRLTGTYVPVGNVTTAHTFDLRVGYPNCTAIPNANVTLLFYGGGGGIVGSWLTNSTGWIPQQNLTNANSPYNVTIVKTGFQTYIKRFTVTNATVPIKWEIALIRTLLPSWFGWFFYICGMGGTMGILIIWVKRRRD